jgi:hypothetical protein
MCYRRQDGAETDIALHRSWLVTACVLNGTNRDYPALAEYAAWINKNKPLALLK